MKSLILIITYSFLFISVSLPQNRDKSSQISGAEVEKHLRFIASDELAGRRPGTYGADVAARYIAEQFRENGLKPFDDCKDYFQNAEYKIQDNKDTVTIKSRNVIGYIKGTNPVLSNEYILLCAHYDHLGTKEISDDADIVYNGARDNGMGTVAIISAAKIISSNPPARSIIIVAFTGEEEGMLGSKYFIKHPPFPLENISFVLNNDGGGYNDTTLVRVAGLNKASAKEIIIETIVSHNLKCLPYPEEFQYLYDLSDNAPFAEIGISAVTVSPGFDKVDEEILKYIHTVEDEADENFNYSYLLKFVKVYTDIALAIANRN